MKKNAFTLVELIAIITILAIIVVFSVPALVSTLQKQEETKYKDFLENIYIATENHIVLNEDKYPSLSYTRGKAVIQIKDLIENNYIKKDLVNPKTKANVDVLDTIIVTRNLDRTYDYKFYSGNYTTEAYPMDGLILHFDGYNKPENNNWKDLSGNYGGALSNFDDTSGWNGDHILFDGVNDYISINNIKADFDSALTIVGVYKIKSIKENSVPGVIGSSTIGEGRILYGYGSKYAIHVPNENSFVMNFAVPDTWLASNNTFTLDRIYDMTAVYKGTSSTSKNRIYINSNQVLENNTANLGWGFNGLVVGKAFGLNAFLNEHPYANMELYGLMIYNRELSQEEIKRIYEINKVRYGIGE